MNQRFSYTTVIGWITALIVCGLVLFPNYELHYKGESDVVEVEVRRAFVGDGPASAGPGFRWVTRTRETQAVCVAVVLIGGMLAWTLRDRSGSVDEVRRRASGVSRSVVRVLVVLLYVAGIVLAVVAARVFGRVLVKAAMSRGSASPAPLVVPPEIRSPEVPSPLFTPAPSPSLVFASSTPRPLTESNLVVVYDSRWNQQTATPAPLRESVRSIYVLAPESEAAALRKYPDLGDTSSKFHRTFYELLRQYREQRSPLIGDREWPMKIAEETAAILRPPPR